MDNLAVSKTQLVTKRPRDTIMTILKKGSIGHEILSAICNANLSRISRRTGSLSALGRVRYEDFAEHRKWRQAQQRAYQRLKKNGYIVETGKRKKSISLTPKGSAFLVLECMRRESRILPERKLCIVSFDIPRDQQVLRRSWLQVLKALGFAKRHHSLWVCRYDHAQHLRYFADSTSAKHLIAVYIGNEVVSSK